MGTLKKIYCVQGYLFHLNKKKKGARNTLSERPELAADDECRKNRRERAQNLKTRGLLTRGKGAPTLSGGGGVFWKGAPTRWGPNNH